MPKFYSTYDRPRAEATPAGDEFEILYDLTYGEYGEPILVPNGKKVPLRARIQANATYGVADLTKAYSDYLKGEDIQIIIKRLEDVNPMEGFYGDFSEYPDCPLDLINKLKKSAFALNMDGTVPEELVGKKIEVEEKGSAENGT